MKPKKVSAKSIQFSKDQTELLIIVAVATLISVFCLVSAKSLVSKSIYQGKVISARHKSADQIKSDISNANTLVDQYKNVFIGDSSQNIIGGRNEIGNQYATPPNGDNGQIVLHALPTKYDFPALLTSLQKMMNSHNLGNQSIGGTDQAITVKNDPSDNPQAVNINITLSGTGNYSNAENFIKDLERSIRPFDVTKLSITGSESDLVLNLNVTTYYQPAKTLSITSKEIR